MRTAAERIDAWRHVRLAATDPLDAARQAAVSPAAVAGEHPASTELPAAAVEVVHRVASDPGRLTRSWADRQIAELGEERYTELVGVVAIASVIDRFHLDGVGDVGAWVSQSTGSTRANVSRTLSLVPVTEVAWRDLVDSHYSRGAEFMEAIWERPLTRPQVELVASRTTGLNECFY